MPKKEAASGRVELDMKSMTANHQANVENWLLWSRCRRGGLQFSKYFDVSAFCHGLSPQSPDGNSYPDGKPAGIRIVSDLRVQWRLSRIRSISYNGRQRSKGQKLYFNPPTQYILIQDSLLSTSFEQTSLVHAEVSRPPFYSHQSTW